MNEDKFPFTNNIFDEILYENCSIENFESKSRELEVGIKEVKNRISIIEDKLENESKRAEFETHALLKDMMNYESSCLFKLNKLKDENDYGRFLNKKYLNSLEYDRKFYLYIKLR